jgi:peptidoglycan/xylan/chitin deacetylase (PgdA/CDA1 family)
MFTLQVVFYLLVNPHSEENNQVKSADNLLNLVDLSQPGYDLQVDTLFAGLSQSVQIKGKGQNNNLLGLWHNGKYSSSAIINNGSYLFPPQSLYIGKNNFLIWSLSEEGKTSLVDSFSIDYYSQRLHLLSIPFTKLETNEKIVALTFDAGSEAHGADSIIQILDEQGLKLTFFLTGTFIRKFPEIVQNLISNGHELANHSYSHPHLTSFAVNQTHNNLMHTDRTFIQDQLYRTDSLFYNKFGQHLKPFWRAPFGEINDQILIWAAEYGYKHIGWSAYCDTRDWVSDKDSELYRTGEEIYQNLIDLESKGRLRGAVILMHVHTDRPIDKPFKILPKLINTLQDRGYKIVPISSLLTTKIPT